MTLLFLAASLADRGLDLPDRLPAEDLRDSGSHMPLTPEDLQRSPRARWPTTTSTRRRSGKARATTTCSQNIDALLQHIEAPPPFDDAGLRLRARARPGDVHRARATARPDWKASPRLAAMARAHSGCEVLEQSFLAAGPAGRSASTACSPMRRCSTCPAQELPRVLRELHADAEAAAACCSARTRAATARRAGTASATARSTTGDLARPHDRRRLRRADSLLSSGRAAARAAAVAGERVAQDIALKESADE